MSNQGPPDNNLKSIEDPEERDANVREPDLAQTPLQFVTDPDMPPFDLRRLLGMSPEPDDDSLEDLNPYEQREQARDNVSVREEGSTGEGSQNDQMADYGVGSNDSEEYVVTGPGYLNRQKRSPIRLLSNTQMKGFHEDNLPKNPSEYYQNDPSTTMRDNAANYIDNMPDNILEGTPTPEEKTIEVLDVDALDKTIESPENVDTTESSSESTQQPTRAPSNLRVSGVTPPEVNNRRRQPVRTDSSNTPSSSSHQNPDPSISTEMGNIRNIVEARQIVSSQGTPYQNPSLNYPLMPSTSSDWNLTSPQNFRSQESSTPAESSSGTRSREVYICNDLSDTWRRTADEPTDEMPDKILEPSPPVSPPNPPRIPHPRDITPEMAIKILERPITDGSNSPDTIQIVRHFNQWKKSIKRGKIARISKHIIGQTRTKIRDFCVTPQPWNELGNEKIMYLRMHNWLRLIPEAKERFLTLNLSAERDKYPEYKRKKFTAGPLPVDQKNLILNEMRQASKQYLNEKYLKKFSKDNNLNFPQVKNFHNSQKKHVKKGHVI